MGTGSFMSVKRSLRKRRKLSAHHVEVIELVLGRFDFEFVLKVKKLSWRRSKSGCLQTLISGNFSRGIFVFLIVHLGLGRICGYHF